MNIYIETASASPKNQQHAENLSLSLIDLKAVDEKVSVIEGARSTCDIVLARISEATALSTPLAVSPRSAKVDIEDLI